MASKGVKLKINFPFGVHWFVYLPLVCWSLYLLLFLHRNWNHTHWHPCSITSGQGKRLTSKKTSEENEFLVLLGFCRAQVGILGFRRFPSVFFGSPRPFLGSFDFSRASSVSIGLFRVPSTILGFLRLFSGFARKKSSGGESGERLPDMVFCAFCFTGKIGSNVEKRRCKRLVAIWGD